MKYTKQYNFYPFIPYQLINSVVYYVFPYLLVHFSAVNCKPYDPPINGLTTCSYSGIWDGDACTPQCNENKEFARVPAFFYICKSSGVWDVWAFDPDVSREMPWPDCTGRPIKHIYLSIYLVLLNLQKEI